MNSLSKDEIKKLAEIESKQYVSIYIPTHRSGEAVTNGHDIILFKNQIQEVKNKLIQLGMSESQAKNFLKDAYDLIEDTGFWYHQSEGLAVFIADSFFQYYTLPFSFESSCAVTADGFHLKELIPALTGQAYYYVLALSLNHVRCFTATKHHIKEIALPEDMPDSYEKAMKLTETEKILQFRSNASNAGGGTMYHGQGGGKDDRDESVLEEYLRRVEKAVYDIVKEGEAPLVLVGTEEIKSLYGKANQYKHLAAKSVAGNPDGLKPKEIHEKTLPVVNDYFQKELDTHIKRYNELAGTGKASYDINTIVPAAANGRIEALFVAKGSQKWGKFVDNDQSVRVHDKYEDGDVCLVNKAAIDTLLNSGTTYVMEKEDLPESRTDTEMVAVLRF